MEEHSELDMESPQATTGPAGEVSDEVVETANELYWGSDASVNRLAQELDLSKGALYDLISPYPAGFPCPRGDGEMVYANRTARARGFVSCPTCGLEDEEAVVRERLETMGHIPEIELPDPYPPPSRQDRTLERLMVGSALTGAAVGFALARLLRRR